MIDNMTEPIDYLYILAGEHQFTIKALDDVDESFFRYSIPINYHYQAPLFLSVNGEFLSYKIIDDEGIYNKLIEFCLPSMKKNTEIKISFNYKVLARRGDYKKIKEKISFDELKKIPDSEKKWLESTKSIQSNNLLIKITARLLQGFSNDIMHFCKKIMFWGAYRKPFFVWFKTFIAKHPLLNRIFLSDMYFYRLEDALSCLLFGACCTGRSNLQTALFRARGVPARDLICTCVFYGKEYWMDGQHYITEFFCPGYRWIRTQPGQMLSPPKDNIILRIVSIEDENIAGNGTSEQGGMASWFWFSNKNVFFGIPKGFMSYKFPEKRKYGVPSSRGWTNFKTKITHENAEKIFSITGEVWELFTKNAGRCKDDKDMIFNKGFLFHRESEKKLKNLNFDAYIDNMKKAKKEYLKL
jgi:hypothetical protein